MLVVDRVCSCTAGRESKSNCRGRCSAQRLQARLFDLLQLPSQPLVFALLGGCALVVPIGQVRTLERIGLEVVHLPLIGHCAVGVVVAGELVAPFTDADNMVGRLRVGAFCLS